MKLFRELNAGLTKLWCRAVEEFNGTVVLIILWQLSDFTCKKIFAGGSEREGFNHHLLV